ncbi:MAG: hypothetical protein HRU11_02410 [Parvularculaceae bacterium]|nr:hypothetical protein [Parvularculaceae bacterium]
MRVEGVTQLKGVRGFNLRRIAFLAFVLLGLSAVVALFVTNAQVDMVGERLPPPTVAEEPTPVTAELLITELLAQQALVEEDALAASAALVSARDLVRCDSAPSALNQGRAQVVGESLALNMGLSVSPLLGFVGLNAYQRFQCDWDSASADAPWFMADAVFFGLVGLVLVILFKDILLSWVPPMKAAIDAIEQLLQLGAAPVALASVATMFTAETGLVFAEGTYQVAQWLGEGQPDGVYFAGLPVSGISFEGNYLFVGNWLAAFVGMAISFVLFVAGSLVAGLVMLMPIPLFDSLLRSTRGGAMAGMAGTSVAAPELSLVVAIPVFILALIIFPFALRLMVFGAVNALDLLPGNRSRGMGNRNFVRAFVGKAMPDLPKRTAGRVQRDAKTGVLTFTYAPLFIFPRRALEIAEDHPLTVVEGILMPSIRMGFRGTGPAAFLVPARYRKHGQQLAQRLGLAYAVKGLDGTVHDGAAPGLTGAG